MLTDLQKSVLLLVKSGLTGEKYPLPDNFDLSEALNVAKKHYIESIVYYGALNCGVSVDLPEMQELMFFVCTAVTKSNQQEFEIKRLSDTFEQSGIDFLPLKGIVLRPLYPKGEMRMMSDADILIKTEQYDIIKSKLESLGYKEYKESDHELVWKKPGLYLELHKRIMPSYNKDYYSYFGDGWRLAKECDGYKHRYCMSDEDCFIFMFSHFAKHYRDGGIGIKHITDIWVYMNNKTLDYSYIEQELLKLSLLEFYKNIKNTILAWFNGAEFDDKSLFITKLIFGSGAYGTHESHVLWVATQDMKKTGSSDKAKALRKLRLVFPNYQRMCSRYPILRKYAVLTPVFWVVRAFSLVFLKRENIKVSLKKESLLKGDAINTYQESLNFVGLDFNFDE